MRRTYWTRGVRRLCTALVAAAIGAGGIASVVAQDAATPVPVAPTGAGAIFFHPDGPSASHWDALRFLTVGPDGKLNWDGLEAMAPYVGAMSDRITASSHGGAVTHATGTRAYSDSFGLDADGNEYVSANGTTNTIMEEAVLAGLGTALVQSGSLVEPGTAAFVAEAPTRGDREEIALEVVESGVDIMLGGGEEWLLPAGTAGTHCAEGSRTDGQNLIARAQELGYTVVYTRDELMALPADVTRVLGVFACDHTFNDGSEEENAAAGLPVYVEAAPTIAEMMEFAVARVSANPNGFLVVAEEEGTDNLCNSGNASGCLDALARADAGFGVIQNVIAERPNTFMVTTSDSAAGSMSVVAIEEGTAVTPLTVENGGPCDGVEGAASAPFVSAADAAGTTFPFAICWSTYDDLGSGVIARAHGQGATDLLPVSGITNTDIYRMLYTVLFGVQLP